MTDVPFESAVFLPSVARAERRTDERRFPNRSSTCPGAVAVETNLVLLWLPTQS